MKPNRLDLKRIHPRNGSRFSPNLYQFMSSRKHRGVGQYGRVYQDRDGVMWLGYVDDGFLMGARLMQVLCTGSKTQTFAFPGLGPLEELEGFWERYQEHGRCAIDPDHNMAFIGDEARWAEEGGQRTCLWCGGVHQRQIQWVERILRNRWVTVDSDQPQHA